MYLVALMALAAELTIKPRNVQDELNAIAADQRACALEGVYYFLFSHEPGKVSVMVSGDTYDRRKVPEIASKILCSLEVARRKGYKTVLLKSKRY